MVRSGMVEIYLHSPIYLLDIVLNSLSTGTDLPFLQLAKFFGSWSFSLLLLELVPSEYNKAETTIHHCRRKKH
jgi:hypothetical protein